MKIPLSITKDACTGKAKTKNILSAMSSIIEEVKRMSSGKGENETLDVEDILSRIEAQTKYLGSRMSLSQIQVLILAAITDGCSQCHRNLSDIAENLHIPYLRLLEFHEDIDDLKRKDLMRMDKNNCISLPKDVLKAFSRNIPYTPPVRTGLTTISMMRVLDEWFDRLEEDEMDDDSLMEESDNLLKNNPDTAFSQTYRRLGIDDYSDIERQLFLYMSRNFYINTDDHIMRHDIEEAFSERFRIDIVLSELHSEKLMLMGKGIIEFCNENGMKSKDAIHITDSVKKELFSDACTIGTTQEVTAEIISHDKINVHMMYYNDREKKQILVLKDMLSPERYLQICAQLKNRGLRTGFSCLFYGGPGTGKTETVYQIARLTGRDLMTVDVNRIKSCWVGESEKNIKGLFADYRRMVQERDTAPILLFNEADAIFGIRQEGAQRAVDKMENSIQNIILQEMEDLDGILIATTNLTGNLDKAFERRFLYKILFEKPSTDTKMKIWQSMLPELSAAEARELSESFDFSGGQIENISRKKSIQEIIDGTVASFDSLKEFCSEEVLDKGGKGRRIGY